MKNKTKHTSTPAARSASAEADDRAAAAEIMAKTRILRSLHFKVAADLNIERLYLILVEALRLRVDARLSKGNGVEHPALDAAIANGTRLKAKANAILVNISSVREASSPGLEARIQKLDDSLARLRKRLDDAIPQPVDQRPDLN